MQDSLGAVSKSPMNGSEKLYLKGEEKLCLSKAKHQLVLGDGDLWIKNIAQGPYFMATYQLDWRHLTEEFMPVYEN